MSTAEPQTSKEPLVSIIIVTYNAPEYVKRCLDDVRTSTQGVPYEVVVVDNASEAPTRELLQSRSDIRLILNDTNKLWCAGCNDGIRAANPSSKYILLLNSDVEIQRPDWLQVLITVMESDPRAVMAGPEQHRLRFSAPVFGWIDGHCMLIRRSFLDEVGLLDCNRWPWAGAPAELTAAAYSKGYIYKVVNAADNIVFHHKNKSYTKEVKKHLKTLPKPKVVFGEILGRYGVKAHPSLMDVGVLAGPESKFAQAIFRRLDPKQFYYTPPVAELKL